MHEVVLPLKNLTAAKSRLRGVLIDQARSALVVAMAEDLIEVLAQQSWVSQINVVAGEHWDFRRLRDLGATVLFEHQLPGNCLNELLTSAVQRCHGSQVLILHGDLPFANQRELVELGRVAQRYTTVICPDRLRTGTNALKVTQGLQPTLHFGEKSFAKHKREIATQTQHWTIHDTPGFARDIDQESDLAALLEIPENHRNLGPRMRRWVMQHQDSCGEPRTQSRSENQGHNLQVSVA
ncbi:MAG: 2-phospho-L-lactate guanylyltransferase [Pseudomonadota bacterium]